MTFNQWAGGKPLDGSMRLAFEGVWDAMTRGCTPGEASRLLSDLLESLPEPETDAWDDDE